MLLLVFCPPGAGGSIIGEWLGLLGNSSALLGEKRPRGNVLEMFVIIFFLVTVQTYTV